MLHERLVDRLQPLAEINCLLLCGFHIIVELAANC
jgi:hypothetical protein